MKKTLCLLFALTLCLTGCGDVAQTNTSSIQTTSETTTTATVSEISSDTDISSSLNSNETSTVSTEIDEEELINGAKSVVTDWFSLMSDAKYSDAAKLCTDEMIETYHFNELVDGENQIKAVVEFTDNGKVSEKDGYVIITLKLKTYAENAPESFTTGSFNVKYSDGKFLLDGIDEDDDSYTEKAKQKSAESNAKLIYIACNTVTVELENDENYRVIEGTYKKDDGSLFSDRVNKSLLDYDLGENYDYEIVFADGKCTVTFYDIDNNVTAAYPSN